LLIPIENPSANRFAAPRISTIEGFSAAPATPETTANVVDDSIISAVDHFGEIPPRRFDFVAEELFNHHLQAFSPVFT